MLTAAGFNVEVEEVDWATFLDRRNQPDAWDIFLTAWERTIAPHQFAFLHSKAEWPGWTNNPDFDRILNHMDSANTEEKLRILKGELHEELWNDSPAIHIGSFSKVTGINEKVKGYRDFLGPVILNVSVEE